MMFRHYLVFFLLLTAVPIAVGASSFSCPMQCEGAKGYAKQGTCPVCGMDLERSDQKETFRPLNTRDYRLDVETLPSAPKKGDTVLFILRPMRTREAKPVVTFDETRGATIRVTFASQDLVDIRQYPTRRGEDGSFRFERTFGSGGNYVAYVEFTPTGAGHQVFPIAVSVSGDVTKGAQNLTPKHTLSETKEGVLIKFNGPKEIKTGISAEFSIAFEVAAKPALSDLGEILFISEDTTQFLPSHRIQKKSNSFHHVFSATFRRPGLYRLWLEAGVNEKKIPLAYTIQVIQSL